MSPRWPDIPSDLLYEIDEELAYIEKVRVRAACVWWNSVLPNMPNQKLPQLPWLLHTTVCDDRRLSQALYNICEEKNYKLDLPEIEGKALKGSTHGWLVTISVNQKDEDITPCSPDLCLLNPLTGVQFQLPPRSTFPDVVEYNPNKVGSEYRLIDRNVGYFDTYTNRVHRYLSPMVVTSSSCIENCVVAATYCGLKRVAWCMLGHEKWKDINIYSNTSGPQPAVLDIIFSDNKLYVLNSLGRLFQVEFLGESLDLKVTVIVGRNLPLERIGGYMFLVEGSDKKLRMAVRRFNNQFEVLELNLQKSHWVYTNNTGNDMLFLGYNHSLSVPTYNFPGYTKNHIYFADDEHLNMDEGDALIGMYNLEEGKMEKLAGVPNVKRSFYPQPIWVTPPS